MAPRLQRYLTYQFRLSSQDAEDCVQSAIEKFVRTYRANPGTLQDPYNCLYQAAKNSAIDFSKQQTGFQKALEAYVRSLRPDRGRQKRAYDPESSKGWTTDWISFQPDSAAALIEALMDDVAADPSASVRVIFTALQRLTPIQRTVMEAILLFGPRYNASDAEEDMYMTPVAFRANKRRAYAALRKLIPEVAREMGIELRGLEEADAQLHPRHQFPSSDQEGL